MVYAIGSNMPNREDEPLFLIEDSSYVDGLVILKYVPDDNGEREQTPPVENDGELTEVWVEILNSN
jgi:hypothetical protein